MIEFSHWDIYFKPANDLFKPANDLFKPANDLFKPANDLFKTAAVYCERVIFLINYVFRYRFFTFLKHSFRERIATL